MEKKQYKKMLENALKFHKLIGASKNYKRVKILLEDLK
jgi:hypothetical protein